MSTHEPPAAFSWLNLRAELTGKQARVLIDGASGTARRGRVLAIIGPSGAGKSTLLQALAGRLDRSSKLRLSGTLAPPPSRPGAFVYQEDAFFSRLTVAETLRFAAALRAAQSTSVADVLAAMGLAEVASSAVGGGKVRGISGGERKRLAIGCALLAWALDIASVDPDAAEASKARVARLALRWREATAEATARLVEEAPLAPLAPARQSGWSAQLGWCLWRSWRQSGGFAAPSLLAMRVVGSVVPGLAFGCIWFDLPAGRGSLKARVGLLQDGEGACVRRERAAGALRLGAYFFGKVAAELPVTLLLPALLVCVTHPLAGLACPLPVLVALLALEAMAASALGLLAGAVAPSLDIGLELTKALTTLSTVFGGLYFDAATLPRPLRWVPRASIVRVAWDGAVAGELAGLGGEEEELGVEGGRRAVEGLLALALGFGLAAFVGLAARAPRASSTLERPAGFG
ncbi:hypothetical protein EMIHUDRAFT_253067 [Emiliania huxleyi CCMP1516]|uniref:ABC transporter domain-containing protein n=2 Tax=Emiliania huxleyi TaxID=2903 RepID=A0A0D3KCY9_EMIH1|nr:hypothetical protein EMIHUDRAFT_253067 [Emiliania huxleyi CCMP1516]EOD33624.1 hypothetical protein EMIHUDRAFT_253067 [Emiliania huxleyi CCMP1516]|eukprot:XP_005786053.1 hypothetical protein EMIHUDRAFT_253067 [Emiliania huxleyi CCMP1516]